MSVLKSLSGYQMYRLKMRTRVKRTDVLQFLLRDDQFPRSCLYCLTQLESSLTPLPRSEGVLEVLDGAAKFIAARATRHARSARPARAHRRHPAAHLQRALAARRNLFSVRRHQRRATHDGPESAEPVAATNHTFVRGSRQGVVEGLRGPYPSGPISSWNRVTLGSGNGGWGGGGPTLPSLSALPPVDVWPAGEIFLALLMKSAPLLHWVSCARSQAAITAPSAAFLRAASASHMPQPDVARNPH